MQQFDFKNLFVFEMANNHQGSVEHGLKIINAMADIAERQGVRGAIKFQFRDLDTFIHPHHQESKDNKHIPRFLATRLTEDQFVILINEAKKRELVTMCTPFDEVSVDRIERLGIEVIKIGSSSAHDWPLLERVTETGKPIVCSMGGLRMKDIDRVVDFFQKRRARFAIMHCVSIYPTPPNELHLDQIELLRKRYPGIVIGFSTHEDPANFNIIGLAYAKGARLFEKHVGIAAETIQLNKYSATPQQVEEWIRAYKEAAIACGGEGEREINPKEKDDLRSLMRGVYAKKEIKAGNIIRRSDVFFAMPLVSGQLVINQWREGLRADKDYDLNQPLGEALA